MLAPPKYSLLNVAPTFDAPLDSDFRPAILATRAYERAVAAAVRSSRVRFALERNADHVSRWEFAVFEPGAGYDDDTLRYVERTLKFLLWSHGACTVYVSAPSGIGEHLRAAYSAGGARQFDVDMMTRAFDRPFSLQLVDADDLPPPRQSPSSVGGHWDGCRIGFDLGASDYKIAAVNDGKLVYSEEIPWDPKSEPDQDYHRDKIQQGLLQAAAHLPRVDAIGGSSAGIYIDNKVMVASLFRSVPRDRFEKHVKSMFLNIKDQWNKPLEIINDGDVTALAGAVSLGRTRVFGLAMGSSEAVGYLNALGRVTGRLNELAFAPVDFDPNAAPDEWSGDHGVGAMYFSQQAVNRLAPKAGFSFPDDMDLPTRLKLVQRRAEEGDPGAKKIFETIGTYLGYTIPYYAQFYDIETVMVLGRVTSGRGGEIIIERANQILTQEFPEVNERLWLYIPDEKSRRVGQAFAAASLPALAPAG